MESLTSPKIIVGVHCLKLRTKGMYIPALVDPDESHVLRQVRDLCVLVCDDADRLRARPRAGPARCVLQRSRVLQALNAWLSTSGIGTRRSMMKKLALSALFLTATMATLSARPATLQGTYVEARTSEVFAGACVINGEAATTGREALLAWKVDSGASMACALDGLAVVAAVSGDANLSVHEIGGEVANTRTALFVDARATEAQRTGARRDGQDAREPGRRHRGRSHSRVDRVRRRRSRHSGRGEDGAAHGAARR